MLRKITLFFAVVIAAHSVGAEEMTLPVLKVWHQVYTNVTIFGANETDLYFSHAHGLTNVKLKYLDQELQKRFGYDPVKAANAERQQMEDERRFNEALAKRLQAERAEAEKANSLRRPETLGENSLADATSDSSLLNKPMPTLAVGKWLTEKPEMEGKFAIFFFWTSWSAPCRRYIPELNAWQKKYKGKLAVVGISTEGEQEVTQRTGPAIDFGLAVDTENRFGNAVGITDVPQILLVDPNGIIRYRGHPAAINEKVLQRLFEILSG